MVAKKRLVLTFCILGFLQTSFAGFDRFWILSKDANTQIGDTWDSMSDEEQQVIRHNAVAKSSMYAPEIIAEKWKALFDQICAYKK